MDELKTGIREAKRGNTKLAIRLLQQFAESNNFPEAKAWFGYCTAYENQEFSRGIDLCRDAIRCDRLLPDGYLALSRIYLRKSLRKPAIETLQQGLKMTRDEEISTLLVNLGVRKKPIIPFLSRDNFLNIFLGRILGAMGMRK